MTNKEVLAEIQRLLVVRTNDDTCVEEIHDLIQRRYKEVHDEMIKHYLSATNPLKGT